MSVNKTLEERGSRYGQFADHAKIAQGVQDVMRSAPKWNDLDPDMKQALTVIADKIGRILNGDPFYVDNWHDIQGYARLIENRIEMITEDKACDSLYDEPMEDATYEEDEQIEDYREYLQEKDDNKRKSIFLDLEVMDNSTRSTMDRHIKDILSYAYDFGQDTVGKYNSNPG